MHTINCSALHIFVSHMDGKPNCRTCFPEPSRAKGMHNDGKTGSLTPVESIAWWPQCATTIGVNRALRAPRVAIGAVFAPDRWGTNGTVFRDPLVTGRPFSRKTLVDCHARRAGFFLQKPYQMQPQAIRPTNADCQLGAYVITLSSRQTSH